MNFLTGQILNWANSKTLEKMTYLMTEKSDQNLNNVDISLIFRNTL